MQIFKHA